MRCEVTQEEWGTEIKLADSISDSPVHTFASFAVEEGQPGARRANPYILILKREDGAANHPRQRARMFYSGREWSRDAGVAGELSQAGSALRAAGGHPQGCSRTSWMSNPTLGRRRWRVRGALL